MKKNESSWPENLDFYKEITIAYENMLMEIDYLVEGSQLFTDPTDPRKIKLDEFLYNLKNNMEAILNESKESYDIRQEVEERFDEIKMKFVCDECGSEVDTRVGIMKWNDDKDPSTPEEWNLLEKFNEHLDIPVRWVTFCTNPECHKIWKEGEFEEEIALPKIGIIKDKIRNEVLKNRGGKA